MKAEQLLQHFERISEAPDAITRLRHFILDLAVRGKLVEQDPSDEPAAELLKQIAAEKARLVKVGKARKLEVDPVTNEEIPFQVPSNWVWTRLGTIGDWGSGSTPSRGNLDFYGGGITWLKSGELNDNRAHAGTPVLRVGNLFTSNKWYYSDLELDDDKYCDDGDLIFSWSASFGPFIWNGGRTIYHYHIWKLPLHSPDDLSRDYLYLYLLDKTAEIKAAGHGISMVHMTKEKMEKLEVPLPPLAEQKRIVAKVDELMAICDQLEAQITQRQQDSRRFLEAVLQEALSPATAEVS